MLISLVLGFARLNGTTYRTRNYPHKYAPVTNDFANDNPVGALCSHFQLKSEGHIEEFEYPFYLSLDIYKGTLTKAPIFENSVIKISEILLSKIYDLEGENCSNSCFSFYLYVRITLY